MVLDLARADIHTRAPLPIWVLLASALRLAQNAKTQDGKDVIIRYDSIAKEIGDDLGHRTSQSGC
jgi:hypothetical protein